LGSAEDDDIADYFIRTAFPSTQEIGEVLAALEAARSPLKMNELQQLVNIRAGKLKAVLTFLEVESPLAHEDSAYVRTPVRSPVVWRR